MDIINGTFNWVAAVFIFINAMDIYRKKDVAGHTYPSTIFFTTWSFFSVPYFWVLEQFWTVIPTVAMFVANLFLFLLVMKYRRRVAPTSPYEPPTNVNCRCVITVKREEQ